MDKEKLNKAPGEFQLGGLRLSSSCGLGALSGAAPSKRVFYCEWPHVELKDFSIGSGGRGVGGSRQRGLIKLAGQWAN